ncbi:MAG: prenyltransferase/squalene oxidase repeat-containing protein [Planctomycetaceae bacterium]
MAQIARLAPKVLGNSTSLVVDFFRSQQQEDGGFPDRAGRSDLYYTVFGIEGLIALQQPIPTDRLYRYVKSFGDGADLDLVHLSCLARCWSSLPVSMQHDCPRAEIVARLPAHRTPDGGFESALNQTAGSIYASFMAVGAYQDVKEPIPDEDRLLDFIESLRDPGAGFKTSLALPMSVVPVTSGAVALLRHLNRRVVDPGIADWILSCFDAQGGFRPAPDAPLPDLLSTATALHALSSMKVEIGQASELCLDFIDTLWTNSGGFYGHWEDTHVDVEYTYYALLALGHLAL